MKNNLKALLIYKQFNRSIQHWIDNLVDINRTKQDATMKIYEKSCPYIGYITYGDGDKQIYGYFKSIEDAKNSMMYDNLELVYSQERQDLRDNFVSKVSMFR